ncbi:barwin-like endoglucanase, partial [Aureobasidium melanogenum]
MLFSISTLAAISAFASAALAAPFSANPNTVAKRALSGQATFYGGNTSGGQCSFTQYTLPSGVYGTALSSSNWDNAANCGACVSVKGPNGNSITAMITDQCPGCGTNHLDLYEDAFPNLAPKSAGVIDVTWDYVACPITSPLSIHMKTGVSQYWFSAQVVNAKRRTTKLEVSTDSG